LTAIFSRFPTAANSGQAAKFSAAWLVETTAKNKAANAEREKMDTINQMKK